uniref:Uncharacterized protein n=1 Tax=Rhinopithecus roxellana TaxID=61622 RepID=A0A2K6P7C8_RHIRO
MILTLKLTTTVIFLPAWAVGVYLSVVCPWTGTMSLQTMKLVSLGAKIHLGGTL